MNPTSHREISDLHQSPHVVIRASAGTGKTFQLSNRFLGLIRAGEPPEQILAVTFARKAAGEILARVLVRLADAACDATDRAKLAESLQAKRLEQAECSALLRQLLANLHRLQVGTLDSFFLQLAGSMSLELGLPGGWSILDDLDDNRLRVEAVRRVLEAGQTPDLLALVHLLSKGEAARSVSDQILDIVNRLYDVYCETEPAAWQSLARPTLHGDEELRAAVEVLAALPEPAGKQVADAWRKDIEKARVASWDELLAAGLGKAVAFNDGIYNRKPLPEDFVAAYEPLVAHAKGFLVNQLVSQTEGTYRVLQAFAGVYRRLKHEARGLRFDDVPRLLAARLSEGVLDAAAYRLDARVSHLLLDEFQDTSLPQWRVLEPFARRLTLADDGRSLFCVGDVKQAIYGWRGGVSEIFHAVGNQLSGVREEVLTHSYRSSQPVIDTVNRVFASLPRNEALDLPEVAERWASWYAKHSTARGELAGYCRMITGPRGVENEKPRAIEMLAFAAAHVAQLAREAPGRSIGVLVRRNQAVARLIHYLRVEHKLDASEEGGNPLTDSPAVELMLSLLTLADHPGDRVARFHVATSPLGTIVGLLDFEDAFRAQALALEVRQQLQTRGYGETLYEWARRLAEHCDRRDLDRLMQMVELGYGFEERAGVRPREFVEFVRQKRVENPAAAPIRVMTIHQAKGLQFDIVVLPELDLPLKSQPPQVVVGRADALSPIDCVCRYARQDLQQLLPASFQKMFAAWPRQIVNESLCVLYVALTRAIHALHILVAPAPENQKTVPKTFAGLLRFSLADGKKAPPRTQLYEHGAPDWFRADAPAPEAAVGEAAEPLIVKLRPATGSPTRGLERRAPSTLEGGGRVRVEQLLRSAAGGSLSRGALWHRWLEQVAWIEDGLPSDVVLRELGRAEAAGLDLDAELARLRRLLAQEAVMRVLSRAGYADPTSLGLPATLAAELRGARPDLALFRERRFAVRDADAVLSGSVDRLVALSAGGRVIAADVLDFKTDQVAAGAPLDARVDFYRPQLAAYRRAVALQFGIEPACVACRLVFLEADMVRSVH